MNTVIDLIFLILVYELIRLVVVTIIECIKERVHGNAVDWYDEDGK